jgi:hypothetical protein
MRALKGLLKWAQDNAGAEDPPIPARLIGTSGRVGFVVFPLHRGAFDKRLNALENFAMLTKYDFRLDRQIGVCIGRACVDIEIDWLFLDYPWQQDPEMERALVNNYPFRPKPEPTWKYGYPS